MSKEGGGRNNPRSSADNKGQKQNKFENIIRSKSLQESDTSGEASIKQSDNQTISDDKGEQKQKQKTSNISEIAATTKLQDPRPHIKETRESDSQTDIQVIAVSASKGPAAFFNLARKFLVSDEMCDLSALEGAIVTAVDAAHLLERSKLATIVRVQTSYVSVGPKRKKNSNVVGGNPSRELKQPQTEELYRRESLTSSASAASQGFMTHVALPSNYSPSTSMAIDPRLSARSTQHYRSQGRGIATGKTKEAAVGSKELRRARMIIRVKRTVDYKKWLEEHPLKEVLTREDRDLAQTSQSKPQPS